MQHVVKRSTRFCFNSCIRLLLWTMWCVGFGAGFYWIYHFKNFITPIVCNTIQGSSSLFDLLISTLLPYIVFTYAIKSSEPWLLPILCGVKAFILAFSAFGVAFAFGSAGWLVRFFALFSEVLTVPLLLMYCHYFSANPHRLTGVWLWFYPIIAIASSLLTHYYAAPYLAMLLN